MSEREEWDYDADIAAINAIGWRESKVAIFERCDRNWFRWFENEPRCKGNGDKRLQMQLKLWDSREGGFKWSFEINITATPDDEIWLSLTAYSLDSIDQIREATEIILNAWRASQKQE